jgi:hypothetical protein
MIAKNFKILLTFALLLRLTDKGALKAVGSATFTVYIIDGKKRDKAALNKIKPEAIASMTVYKPGSKEAVRLSGDDNVTVIEVVTK